MAGGKFNAFAGVIPKLSPRLLDQRNAQRADNLKAFSGELRSWKRPLFVTTATKGLLGPVKSIYRLNNGTVDFWLNWLTDVDVVPSFLAGDTTKRLYYTGDGSPKKTNLALATSGADLPFDSYEMGIPVPATPTVAIGTAGSTPNSTRTYLMTFVNGWGEEGPPSAVSAPLTFGATGFSINLTALDLGNKAVTSINLVGNVATVIAPAHGFRDGSKVLITNAGQAEYNGRQTIKLVDANTFTFIVVGTPATPATGTIIATGNYNLAKRRIYRSVVGSTGITAWQLVGEIADMTTATFTDNFVDGVLGVVCPSFNPSLTLSSWSEPPANMVGLLELPNQIMAGFAGNTLCFSEPTWPHAWPARYQITFPFNIINIKSYGSTVVVATDGSPYTVTGTTSENMSESKVEDWPEPCASKRGMTAGPSGVIYPSPNGAIQGGLSGFENVSEPYFTRDEWQEQVFPSTTIGVVYDGRYYAFFSDTASSGGGLIMTKAGDAPGVLFHNQYVTAAMADRANSKLYVVQGANINEWDADDNNLIPFDWWSKVMTIGKPTNYGAVIIEALYSLLNDAAAQAASQAADLAFNQTILPNGYTGGEINDAALDEFDINGSLLRGGNTSPYDQRYLQLQVYSMDEDSNMVLSDTILFTGRATERLSSGFESDTWQYRITGNIPVQEFKYAEVPTDMKTL